MRRVLLGIVLPLAGAAACAGTTNETAGESATTTTTNTASSSTSTDGMTSSSAETSTTVSTTTGASTGPSSDSSTFVPRPDAGRGGCDIWAQDCPTGEKCNAWASDGGGVWTDHKCFPVDPRPDAVGEPCSVEGNGVSGIDSCDLGAMCWNVDPETNEGSCVALCIGDEDKCTIDAGSCCQPGTQCVISASATLILCLPTCDPLLQNCEGGDFGCYPTEDDFECRPDQSGTGGGVGTPCADVDECDPGAYCGAPTDYPSCDLEAPGCCIPFCALSDPDCVPGTVCQPWFEPMMAPLGYEDLGACLLP